MENISPVAFNIGTAIGTNMIPLIIFVLAIIFRKKRIVPWILTIVGTVSGVLRNLAVLGTDDPTYIANQPFKCCIVYFLILAVITYALVIAAKKYRKGEEDEDDEDD